MLQRNLWNSYHREDSAAPWRWVSSGAFYGESHGEALLKVTGGEVLTLFGRMLPYEYERRWIRGMR